MHDPVPGASAPGTGVPLPTAIMPAALVLALIASLWAVDASAADAPPPAGSKAVAPVRNAVPDSRKIEKDLQGLPWNQFRSVIESVPKMKADVEAYGPIGWKYVQANYKTHGWKKNIDKLDAAQKKRLVELIEIAKRTK